MRKIELILNIRQELTTHFKLEFAHLDLNIFASSQQTHFNRLFIKIYHAFVIKKHSFSLLNKQMKQNNYLKKCIFFAYQKQFRFYQDRQ